MKIIMSLEELMYINKAVNGVKSEILKIDPNTEIDWPIEEIINSLIDCVINNEVIVDINSDMIVNMVNIYTDIYTRGLPIMNRLDPFIDNLMNENNPTLNILKSMIKPLLPEGLFEEMKEYIQYIKDHCNEYIEKGKSLMYPNE